MGEHFTSNMMHVSPREENLLLWVDMILMKNLSLIIIEDELFRNFAEASSTFFIKIVRAVILAMLPLVEKWIAHEAKIA